MRQLTTNPSCKFIIHKIYIKNSDIKLNMYILDTLNFNVSPTLAFNRVKFMLTLCPAQSRIDRGNLGI